MPLLPNLAALSVLFAAAQVHAQGIDPPARPSAQAATGVPLVRAEVRRVEAAKRTVILDHEEIPNLSMPAMTMAFDVADRKMLEGLKAGDKVRFQVDSVRGKLKVIRLERRK